MKKALVVLSGCGVYDGSEIQESVFTLYQLAKNNIEYICVAPDINQHHVINHIKGEEMPETRNVLTESARIARGNIQALSQVDVNTADALVFPGGFGVAKNLSKWAFAGPDGEILPEIENLIIDFVKAGKPIVGICMAPSTIARALKGTDYKANLTIGNTTSASPYDMEGIIAGVNATGAINHPKEASEIMIDEKLNIITVPTYMMDVNIIEVYNGIENAITALRKVI